ncbi:ABC transporter substrate-binding protein [Pseudochelatococcus contaminans]|uniref:Putative spermidine/putrescine transport system substrate-binding protein n=1 Tax=Pseudochelatococcus contaminans TaxID=1538103 RepID=A0A7W6EIA7_9HYPH|nr:ABC transporter substrate-binding protein [Pseudochelatococcus contaminans]MBB3810547.1 putative spermidine/putrescine transport system substrate-binding protein [Pseudochelatococcus contaminans]
MRMKFTTVALLSSVAMLAAGAVQAQQITFVSQGGAYQEAQTKAILNPVAELLGITIRQDSSPDAWPVIRTQAATGKPIWDVIDTPTKDCIRGGEQGFIEKLDFAQIPNASDLPDDYKSPYSVAYEFYSSVLAYNKDKYGDKPPQGWADFWDVEKFPGTRALRNHPLATLEAALIADGVPRDKLYPLDVDRAFRKLGEIKPHITVWWTSGAQSAQLLADGEADLVMAWNGRVAAVEKEGAPVGYTFNDGLLQFTSLCILKNAPNPDTAVKFVNAALTPEIQANFPTYIDYGPANPAAYDTGKISPERAAQLPSSPANAAVQALVSEEWWSSPEGEEAQRRWASFIQR